MRSPSEFIRIDVGNMRFIARLERSLSPLTCQEFCAILPVRAKAIQARWSGEAAWIPLPRLDLGVGKEGVTGSPNPGEILFHPADHCECEILIPYGKSAFRCKDGDLAGNHFLTIVDGQQLLEKLGEPVLWQGGQRIRFSHPS